MNEANTKVNSVINEIEFLNSKIAALEALITLFIENALPSDCGAEKNPTPPLPFAAVWNTLPSTLNEMAQRIAKANQQLKGLVIQEEPPTTRLNMDIGAVSRQPAHR